MKRWRDLLLVIVLFGILIAFTVWGPGRNQPEAYGQPGSTRSSADHGAFGLQRWLQELGYNARRLEFTEWHIPDDAAALFIISPRQEPFTEAEADETLRWVRNGGTLILVTPTPPTLLNRNELLDQLAVRVLLDDDMEEAERADVTQPVLMSPPVLSVPVHTQAALELQRDDYLPLLATRHGPTLVGIQEGRGYIYLATADYPFSNAGIREPGSAPLILNLLTRVPPGATVLFDEFHHGYNQPPTLRTTAFQQGWGWPIAYTVLVLASYIALTGRRFGRAVPLREDVARRSSAEYVQSLATLFRRSGQQAYILEHYRKELKRRLAKPYGFVPPADDEAFLRELQRISGINDEQIETLRKLLLQLQSKLSADQMVRVVQQIDALVDERGRLR